jgi:hypothetical protein
MKFLCLIHLDPKLLEAMPAPELDDLNGRHLDLNDALRASGHFVEAEALEPVASAACVRVRHGKLQLTDGPFAETKEMVAGFYLLEARDMAEAQQLAARIPSAPLGTVEIRPTRQLIVPGR